MEVTGYVRDCSNTKCWFVFKISSKTSVSRLRLKPCILHNSCNFLMYWLTFSWIYIYSYSTDLIVATRCCWLSLLILIFVPGNVFTAWARFYYGQGNSQILKPSSRNPPFQLNEFICHLMSPTYAGTFGNESSWCAISTNMRASGIMSVA